MTKIDSKIFSILRLAQVAEKTGLSKSTIYLRIQKGTFPKQVKLGERSVGWLQNEVDDWLKSRIEMRDMENEVR